MKKVYFASDFHLGTDGKLNSRDREKLIVRWLDKIAPDALAIYLIGDVFDFWFDYKKVVPRGFTRLIGKLAELCDKGIPVKLFTGNHDMWMKDYFTNEMGIQIYHKPVIEKIFDKTFYIGHGDGLGPGDWAYKGLKRIFKNPIAQWLFRWIHPDIGIGLADYFSKKSRESQNMLQTYLGSDKEWLIHFAESEILENPVDFFIFGHRHLPIDYPLKNGSARYINLGDWLFFQSYAVFDGQEITLQFFENDDSVVYC